MRQPLYIHSAAAISPQETFRAENFLLPVIHTEGGAFRAMDGPYADYIPPVAIRRMSRILKMSITTAMQALRSADVSSPDGIIIGTARGGVTDMETMVRDLIRLNEEAMNPTAFIQSTYNSPNGWIAMLSNSNCYNQTYVHRGSAFELAVLDAQMLAAEASRPVYLLVGCYDEMTADHYMICDKQGYWKAAHTGSKGIFTQPETPGSIGGEGAAAFVLSNEKGAAFAKISDLQIATVPGAGAMRAVAQTILARNSLRPADISLVLTGKNGNATETDLYDTALEMFPVGTPVGAFKHLCGEYDTAIGFGLWSAEYMLRRGVVPGEMMLDREKPNQLKRILLLNHFMPGTISAFLVEKAENERRNWSLTLNAIDMHFIKD